MKRRRIIFLCALVLVAAGVVALWSRGPKEPVYQGKKLTYWLIEAHTSLTNARSEQARAAIKALGTNALPYLLHQLTNAEPTLRKRFDGWLSERRLDKIHIYKLPDWKHAVGNGISLLGPDVIPLLPELASYLGCSENNPVSGDIVALAMSGAGEEAVPYLLEAVQSTNSFAKFAARRSFHQYVLNNPSSIPRVIGMLEDADPRIRATAALSLFGVRTHTDLLVAALRESLQDPDGEVQNLAANSLACIGKAATSAIPDLVMIAKGTNPISINWATNAIQFIDPSALPK